MDRERIFLFGMNSIARMIIGYLYDDLRYCLLGITVNKTYCDSDEYFGYPLIPFEEVIHKNRDFSMINCVGYSGQLETRIKIDSLIKENQIPLLTYIHPKAVVFNVEFGESNIVMNNSIIEQYSTVGNGNVFYGGSYICHDAKIGNYNWFSAKSTLAGEITIGNRNFFGINTSIKEKITIGSMATIGAGAVVIHDVPDCVLVVGNPAVVKRVNEYSKQ